MHLRDLPLNGLPLNRKERFYTGTVFPMIAGCDNLRHLDRLLKWFALPAVEIESDPQNCNLQFFTEYGFGESRLTDTRFLDFALGRDTPDILLFIAGEKRYLIGLEAKMYDVPDREQLEFQIGRQRQVLEYVSTKIHSETHLAALLPGSLSRRVGNLSVPTLTWEHLNELYADVSPPYWKGILEVALNEYERLVARSPEFATNRDSNMSGLELLESFRLGTLEFKWMGRRGGIEGAKLNEDVATGRWRTYKYECRREPLPSNPNWFPVEKFAERVAQERS
jgi:hypothetical protein